MADMTPRVTFTPAELETLRSLPDALRALADYHSVSETEADAMDPEIFAGSVRFHHERATELRAEADRIQKEWES